MPNNLTLIAHRGFKTEAPENTLAAFDLAIVHDYPDIEFDVQLTSDSQAVIIHDETVDRTTDGTGRVDTLTLKQLQALDAGSWFGLEYRGQRIPTLRQVLERYAGCANLHIELKSLESNLADIVVGLLIETGWRDEAARQVDGLTDPSPILVISSFERRHVKRSRQLLTDGAVHELLVEHPSQESINWAVKNGMSSYNPAVSDITPTLVRKVTEKGLRIGGWWLEWKPEVVTVIAELGATSAFVDSPVQARAVLPASSQTAGTLIARLMRVAEISVKDLDLPARSSRHF